MTEAKSQVSVAIGEPVEAFVGGARAAGSGWREIAAQIRERSGRALSPSYMTLAR